MIVIIIIQASCPNAIFIDKEIGNTQLIDVGIRFDSIVDSKEVVKIDK